MASCVLTKMLRSVGLSWSKFAGTDEFKLNVQSEVLTSGLQATTSESLSDSEPELQKLSGIDGFVSSSSRIDRCVTTWPSK
jgi:hypothetical protein